MATYTVNSASVGTTLQATAGTLISITMGTSPDSTKHHKGGNTDPVTGFPTSGYLCLLDTGSDVNRSRALINAEADNPALGNKQLIKFNTAFGKLFCSSVPDGATYTVVTA